MPEGRRRPEVAHLEDCDSDESSVKPGTRVEARKHVPSARAPKVNERQQRPGPPDAASDSGYSSHTSGNVANNGLAPLQVPASTQPAFSTRTRPTIHQPDNHQRTQSKMPAPSASTSRKQAPHCTKAGCTDKGCLSSRNPERRYTLQSQTQPQPQPPYQHQRQQSYPTQYPVQNPTTPYQQMPTYQYAQQYGTQPMPTSNGQPPTTRPRAESSARSRPTSWAGGAYNLPPGYMYGSTPPQGSYMPSQHGPPPSPSAYSTPQHPDYAMYQQQQALAALQLGSTPPTNTMGSYPMPAPGGTGAQSSRPLVQPKGQPNDFSTRRVSASYQNYERPAVSAPQAFNESNQMFSARTMMPGSFPSPAVDDESGSESGSSSCSSYSDEFEYEHRREPKQLERRPSHGHQGHRVHHGREKNKDIEYGRDRERDRELMPPPLRRPSLKSAKTTPAVSHHTSREPLRRAPRSDTGLEYISSDNMDSDRTARPVVGRRTTHSESSRQSSRDPSVFTSSSSGRTPGTDYSNEPKSARYIVEDPDGNRRAYHTREEAESNARRLQQKQQRLEDKVLEYQRNMSGAMSSDLTLDNIKRSQQKQSRPSSSRVSGSSKKSGSSKISRTDTSFQIKTGDTVFQINGDAKIEVRQNDEGGQTLIIGSGSGRESSYYASSSRSSGSRIGRSRHGSDLGGRRRRDTIHEEDGYEPGV